MLGESRTNRAEQITMAVSNEQELEIRRLLADGKSERYIVNAVGGSRRQVQNIKKTMPKLENLNLLANDLGPTINRDAAIKGLLALSTSLNGVRRSEMWPILRALFGMCEDDETRKRELDMTDDQFRYLKKQVKEAAEAQGKEALFIPEWLPRHAPVAANDMLIEKAGQLHDRALEYVSDFLSHFPDTSWKYVLNELVCLAFAQATPEPVERRCKRNFETASALQRRLGASVLKTAANDPAPVDAELDRLCI